MAKVITTASSPPPAPGDQVIINLPDPTTFNQATFIVSGTSSPSNAIVLGTLTDTTSGNRIASTPASTICVQNPVDGTLGDWILTFANVPAGTYILAVNQGLPNQGGDSINATVVSTLPQLGLALSTTGGNTVAAVTNPSLTPVLISVVAVASKPTHATPKHQRIEPGDTQNFRFTGTLLTGTPVTVFAVGSNVRGRSRNAP